MTETQKNFETIGIGTKESIKLEPAIVKIVKVSVESVGEKNSLKVTCEVKHPNAVENIKISSARMERKKKLETSGLWFNTDETEEDRKKGIVGNIRKGSILAEFLQYMKCPNVKELEGKECLTIEDDLGYLVFKAY